FNSRSCVLFAIPLYITISILFFFQAEDGIRDRNVTGVQTCALPILMGFKTLAYENGKQVIDFVPGPVTNAMKHGTFLYIDEINMAKPETLPLINGVLDYRRTVTNPFTNEMITAKEGFNVIAAINEG